ncbi:recombinase family protein [Vibrio penaeicida]|uniref:recombinase family protein n=1 Tax=Vibrio penaeicida TaxID=104609 RepID=UPI001CC80F9E|nr:recombinase family protein [Vibrio penaeicida]
MKLSKIASSTGVKPVVITYTRFSSSMQKDGLSEYRQDELTQRHVIDFCEEHDVDLDEVISLRDRGVSAYRGKNMTQGSLSEIISKFKSGELPKVYNEKGEINTFLFIESLDRLTRAKLFKANKLFLDLVEYCNIVVVAESEQKIYSMNQLSSDTGMLDLFSALLTMSRSHNESRMKELRTKANWNKKRQSVIDYFDLPEEERKKAEYPLNATKTCPWWLKPKSDNRGFEFIEENRKAMMFFLNLMLEGYGLTSAIRRLNEEIEAKTFKVVFSAKQKNIKGFATHTFYQLLTNDSNETLIGNLIFHQDFYPEESDVAQETFEAKDLGKRVRVPIYNAKGYYPALLSEIEYETLQYKISQRKQSQSKPTKKVANIAQGILKCPKCGYSYVHNVDNRQGRHPHLVCRSSRSKLCRAFTYRYEFLEHNFLTFCRNLNIAKVLGKDMPDDSVERMILETESKIEKLKIVRNKQDHDMELLVSNIARLTIPSLVEKMQNEYVNFEIKIKQTQQELESAFRDLETLRVKTVSLNNVSLTINELIDAMKDKSDVQLRETLNVELKKIIKGMGILHHSDHNNPFGRNVIYVEFFDGYLRFIAIDKKLDSDELYNLLPVVELSKIDESFDFSENVILPSDYITGLEKGKYPPVEEMAKYYHENPAKLLIVMDEMKSSDVVMNFE